MSQKQIKNGISYSLATLSIIATNYIFHLIAARNIGAIDYGILSGLFGLFGIIAFASVSLQTKATELTSRLIAQNQTNTYKEKQKLWIKNSIVISIGLTLILSLLFPIARSIFHASAIQWFSFIAVFLFTLPLSVIRGFLQGQELYHSLSFNFFLESILKLILTIIAIYTGLGLDGILLGLTISQVPSFIIGIISLKKNLPENTPSKNSQKEQPTFNTPYWTILIYYGIFAAWFNLDMIIVQYLTPENAGNYSVASKLGQLVLFGGTTITNFLFPSIIQKIENKKPLIKTHIFGISTIVIGSLIGIFFLNLWQKFFTTTLFGPEFTNAGAWIKFMGIYGLHIGIIHYISFILMAKGNQFFIFPLLALTLGMFIQIYQTITSNFSQIFTTLYQWSLVMMLLLIIWTIFSRKKGCTPST